VEVKLGSAVYVVYSFSKAISIFKNIRLRPSGGGYYLSFSSGSGQLLKSLETSGLNPLVAEKVTEYFRESFLRDYLRIVDSLGESNGRDRQWWATYLASKNRFSSPLPQLLSVFAECVSGVYAVARNGGVLVLIRPPWPVTVQLEETARRLDLDFRVYSKPLTRFAHRWKRKLKPWLQILKGTGKSLWEIHECRRFLRGNRLWKTLRDKPVYVIKSFAYPGLFDRNGHFTDPYFGRLNRFLKGKLGDGLDIVTIVEFLKDKRACLEKLQRDEGHSVHPASAFLTYKDVLISFISLVWGRMFRPFKVPDGLLFLNYDISALLRQCFCSGGWSIPLRQYLYFRMGLRLSENLKIVGCAITFEGNAWERMLVAGLRENISDIHIAGYQHAVVPSASAGVFPGKYETGHGPLPSGILTTGEVPRKIMLEFGQVPSERIAVSCGLKYNYLYEKETRIRPRRKLGFTVLVALEGVWDVLPLIEYVIESASLTPGIKFVLRAHPVLPLPLLLTKFRKNIDVPNIIRSDGTSLSEDILSSSAVIYWGSTVSLEAVMMGKPVIHFDMEHLTSYDPLLGLSAFKWTVIRQESLGDVIREIEGMPEDLYKVEAEKAKRYAQNYFWPVSESAMMKFLPGTVAGWETGSEKCLTAGQI